jgi:hypothetical protein
MKPIIVGVDIGNTTGLAIYDLNRNLIYAGSKRNISIDSVIREISFYGKPLIIATDKKRVPQPISKIAATFNCRVFNPDHDLTVEEKDAIVKIPIKDVHEKDALSAATYAYKQLASQFNNIDRNLESLGMIQLKDKVKELLLNREAKNIAEAIEKLKPKEEKEEIAKESKEIFINWREKAKKMEEELREERRRNDILKIYSEKLEDKTKDLEKQKQEYVEEEIRKNEETRKKVIKEKELRTRDILIKQLQFELTKQRNLKNVYEENFRLQEELESIKNENLLSVIIIPDFTRETILEINRRFNLKDKIIWIKKFNYSKPSANLIASLRPEVLIGEVDEETNETLRKAGIITLNSVKPVEVGFFASISPEKIENEIKKTERKSFLNWLEDYRERST